MAQDLGIAYGLNLYLDASATMCLVNSRGLGKAKHVDMQNLWIQEGSKAGRFVTKKVGTSVNLADLMTRPLPKPNIEQLMNIIGYESTRTGGRVEVSVDENMTAFQISVLAVGHVRWTGGISVPVTNSMKCKFL